MHTCASSNGISSSNQLVGGIQEQALDKGARCFAPYQERNRTTHGSRGLTTRKRTQLQNEKGGWCKPPLSLELTPQNRKPSRGWDPATPGSQSCLTELP